MPHRFLLPVLAALSLLACAPAPAQRLPLERIALPPGFSIAVYA